MSTYRRAPTLLLSPLVARRLRLSQTLAPHRPETWALLAPLLGVSGAALLGALPLLGIGSTEQVYAAFCLGLALLYLALVPGCEHGGGMALLMALANGAAAIALVDWPAALHGWLALQTMVAALWLVRDQAHGERSLAGLLLGLNAGAVAALGFSL
ncbi:MAG: hypothetical protein ACK4E7_10460 [Permianibacter sp.]